MSVQERSLIIKKPRSTDFLSGRKCTRFRKTFIQLVQAIVEREQLDFRQMQRLIEHEKFLINQFVRIMKKVTSTPTPFLGVDDLDYGVGDYVQKTNHAYSKKPSSAQCQRFEAMLHKIIDGILNAVPLDQINFSNFGKFSQYFSAETALVLNRLTKFVAFPTSRRKQLFHFPFNFLFSRFNEDDLFDMRRQMGLWDKLFGDRLSFRSFTQFHGAGWKQYGEGFFLIPKWERLAPTYVEAVKLLFDHLPGKLNLLNQDLFGLTQLDGHRKKMEFLRNTQAEQSDFFILPAQLGSCFVNKTSAYAKRHFLDHEFGLDLFTMASVFIGNGYLFVLIDKKCDSLAFDFVCLGDVFTKPTVKDCMIPVLSLERGWLKLASISPTNYLEDQGIPTGYLFL